MKIVIDCRYLSFSGIGRFVQGILENLSSEHEYVFLGNKEKIEKMNIKGEIIEDNNSPFSKKGLFVDTKKINECDCFFTPDFIIPFGIKIPVYSTIHDVIFFDFKGINKSYIDYLIKKVLYIRCLKKSKAIFTVSNFTKSRIETIFKKTDKVKVVYNGIYPGLEKYLLKNPKVVEKKNQIVFVGNFKKQKNIGVLLQAMKIIADKSDIRLKIIGGNENLRTFDDGVESLIGSNVDMLGYVSDDEMYKIISESKFLVQPSLYEGFGLPPLEALYLKTKPIISSIEVFKEIYQDYDVAWFDPSNPEELAQNILSEDYQIEKISLGKYSYNNVTQTILNVIQGERLL